MATPLRIVFLGSDVIALPALEWLAREGRSIGELVAVFTQPDRPVGRGQQVVPNGIKRWAQDRALPVFQPERLTEETRDELARLGCDLALVMAYGHILREAFIATPRLGTLNLHASLLPKYRGASPIQTAIACGDRETGVSLMQIVRKLDAGPVADVERVRIDALDTGLEVESKLSMACVPLLARNLPKLSRGELTFHPQDDAGATYCRRLFKEDGALDFSKPAELLAARINGLFPWPGCAANICGQNIKFGLAEAEPAENEAPGVPGDVLATDGAALRIATGGGVLRILRLQRPGGRMLPAVEFLRGFPVPSGAQITSTTMPPLVATEPFRYR